MTVERMLLLLVCAWGAMAGAVFHPVFAIITLTGLALGVLARLAVDAISDRDSKKGGGRT